MASFGLVDERAANQIQSLLICIEMMIASIAHFYIFPYEEWQIGFQRDRRKVSVLNDTLAVRDFVADFKRVVSRWESGTISEQEVAFDLEQSLQHSINSKHNTPEKRANAIVDQSSNSSSSSVIMIEQSEQVTISSSKSEKKETERVNVNLGHSGSYVVDLGERVSLLSTHSQGGTPERRNYGAWSDTISPLSTSNKESTDQHRDVESTSL